MIEENQQKQIKPPSSKKQTKNKQSCPATKKTNEVEGNSQGVLINLDKNR
jgi:hypothetical protein